MRLKFSTYFTITSLFQTLFTPRLDESAMIKSCIEQRHLPQGINMATKLKLLFGIKMRLLVRNFYTKFTLSCLSYISSEFLSVIKTSRTLHGSPGRGSFTVLPIPIWVHLSSLRGIFYIQSIVSIWQNMSHDVWSSSFYNFRLVAN